jgi:hypothetical protein
LKGIFYEKEHSLAFFFFGVAWLCLCLQMEAMWRSGVSMTAD